MFSRFKMQHNFRLICKCKFQSEYIIFDRSNVALRYFNEDIKTLTWLENVGNRISENFFLKIYYLFSKT